MRTKIFIVAFCSAIGLSNCFIGPAKDKNINVDSTAVNQEPASVQNEFNEDDLMEEEVPGRKIDFQNAGFLLSRMLKEIAYMRNFNDSSGVVKIKALDNETFNPIGIPENFEPKYEKHQAGPYIEGFNGLRSAFILSMFTGDERWEERKYEHAILDLSEVELTQQTDFSQPFKYINPMAIKWAWKNFYRGPSASSVSDVSLSTLYDIVFKKFVRTLAVSHQELMAINIENEKNWYRNAVIMEKKHAPTVLTERYTKPQKYSKEELNEFYYPLATGFWIRRSIDGTEDLLWNYLRIIIMDYDYDWGCKNYKICDRG